MRLIKAYFSICAVAGWIIGLAINAVIIGSIVCLVLSLCGCSSSRSMSAESVVTDSLSVTAESRDSVGSRLELETSGSGYLDIRDLKITFYPPVASPDNVPDSVSPLPPSSKPHPATLTIGQLTAGKTSDTKLKDENSVLSDQLLAAESAAGTDVRESRSRDPTPCRWPVLLVLSMAAAMVIFTGYHLWRESKK